MNEPTVLVVHPDQEFADLLVFVLERCGFHALSLTNAVDAIEHVENLDFDVAVVSREMPSVLPQLLYESCRENWLETLILNSRTGWDVQDFIQAVSEAAEDRRWMCYLVAEAWYEADFGVAGRPKNWREQCEQAELRGEPDSYEGLRARVRPHGTARAPLVQKFSNSEKSV